jgi:hypothetical protein
LLQKFFIVQLLIRNFTRYRAYHQATDIAAWFKRDNAWSAVGGAGRPSGARAAFTRD